jgi:hypothetical protein
MHVVIVHEGEFVLTGLQRVDATLKGDFYIPKARVMDNDISPAGQKNNIMVGLILTRNLSGS